MAFRALPGSSLFRTSASSVSHTLSESISDRDVASAVFFGSLRSLWAASRHTFRSFSRPWSRVMSALAFLAVVEYWTQSFPTLAESSTMEMILAASPTASAMVNYLFCGHFFSMLMRCSIALYQCAVRGIIFNPVCPMRLWCQLNPTWLLRSNDNGLLTSRCIHWHNRAAQSSVGRLNFVIAADVAKAHIDHN